MARIATWSGHGGSEHRGYKRSGGTMFRVIARYAPAVAAFGVLTTGSFDVNAQSVERATELPSVTVRYADLNLNTPAGVEELYARLRAAARQVCNVGDARALADVAASKECYRQVLGAAVDYVRLPTLGALHRAESSRRTVS
jgi:UrcA family protein